MLNYNLAIANDHNGFNLKLKILEFLKKNNFKIYSNNPENGRIQSLEKNIEKSVIDLGSYSTSSVDYPDYATKLVQEIIEGNVKYGILICGTGIGMSIAANRNSGIRAALCLNQFMAEQARAHNNANILVLGSKLIEENAVPEIVTKFLNTDFEGGRHASRIQKIN